MPKACDLSVLVQPFAIKDDGPKTRSAQALIELLAKTDAGVAPRDRKRFLTLAIWRLTEFSTSPTSKYGIRYRSEKAVKAAQNGDSTSVFHEHVVPRKWLVEQLLKNPARAGEICELAVACVVTQDEHAALERLDDDLGLFGWERYIDAKVKVLDAQEDGFPDYKKSRLDLEVESRNLRAAATKCCGAESVPKRPR